MPRRHYSSRHSGHNGQKQATRHRKKATSARRTRSRPYGLVAFLAVVVLSAAVAVVHNVVAPATNAALATASCAAAPSLAADTSTDTLLGVNSSSPSQLTADTAKFGHLPIMRVYYTGMPDPNAWTTGVQAINDSAVVLSFRSPPQTVLSGADDAALSHFFDTAPTGHPIYYSYYHEPEPLIQAGDFTLTQYKEAWAHIVAIADGAHNPYLKSTLILMTWDLDPASGINWKDYLPSGNVISTMGWDAYPAGTVHDTNPQPTPPADFMGAAEAASSSVGLPFGFAEFALGTQTDRPQWLAEVASYLRSTGALFGTLFDSTGFPWMELNDSASIQAWHDAVQASGSAGPAPEPSSPLVTSPQPSTAPDSATTTPSAPPSSATAAPSAQDATPGASGTAAPTITDAHVDPAAFAPTGTNHVRVQFKLGSAASIAICVLNQNGAILREIDRPDQPAGWSSSWYFGHDSSGGLLPSGNYPVLIVAGNSAGSTSAQTELTISSG